MASALGIEAASSTPKDHSTPYHLHTRLDTPQLEDDFDPDEYMMDDELTSTNPKDQEKPIPTTEDDAQTSTVPETLLERPNYTPVFLNPAPAVFSGTRSHTAARPSFFNPSPAIPTIPVVPPLLSPTQIDVLGIKDEPSDDFYVEHSPPHDRPPTSFASTNRNTLFVSQATPANGYVRRTHSPAASIESLSTQQAALTTGSDDDLMEIDPQDVPTSIRQRWQAPRRIITIEDDHMKEESMDDGAVQLPGYNIRPKDGHLAPLSTSHAVAIQRQMLKRSNPKKSATPDAFGRQITSEPEAPAFNKHHREVHHLLGAFPDDPSQVDAAMRDMEDHSWMDQYESDDGVYTSLVQRIETLTKKLNNGKITPMEKNHLYKLHKTKAGEDRLRAAARGEVEEETEQELFVQESRQQVARRHRRDLPKYNKGPTPEAGEDQDSQSQGSGSQRVCGGDEHEDAAFARMLACELDGNGEEGIPEKDPTAKPRKKRKPSGPRAKNAREVLEQQRAKERDKPSRKGTRQLVVNPRSKTAKKLKPTPKGGKGGKASKGRVNPKDGPAKDWVNRQDEFSRGRVGNAEDPIGQMILDNLMDNDPIADRVSNPIFNVAPEPEYSGGGNKQTLLQQLFANIPDGSSAKEARSDKQKLHSASKSFGYAKVKAKDGKWLVKGMRSTLYHHQLLGAQWMVSRELSETAPFGGLLADGMGLGKTVQTLACMIANPPADKDRKRLIQSTLIVVPSAVILQWLDEIRHHTEESMFPKIMHYKTSSKIPMAVLRDLDIVITSYTEVMRQFPYPDAKEREKIAHMGHKKWWKLAQKDLGDLHRINWYRVVLDESHAVKNNSSRTSLACQNLKSIYRWCLTGTPLLNRLEELFPYLRFLKANYSMDWKTFQRHFCDADADDCHQRIATLLSYTMMRRTMKTTILGRPILTLPSPHPEIQYVNFSTEERIIYRITENRFRSNINAYFGNNKRGDTRINYRVFLVQLLRLRQCTSHPFMLERTIKESWTSEDIRELRTHLSRLKKNRAPFYEQCELWVSQSEEERRAAQEARDRGEEVPDMLETMPFGKSNFGHKFLMDKALSTLKQKEFYQQVVCCLCSDIPMIPSITDCGHIFCKECLETYMHQRTAEYEDSTFACPSCDRMFTSVKPYKGMHVTDDDMSSQGSTPAPPQRTSGSRSSKGHQGVSKGKDFMDMEPVTKDSTWIDRSDYDPTFPLTPSAKTTALKAILLKGITEAPLDKVVIYVQFRPLARIVGRICEAEDWGFLYLTGDSSLDHRSKVVREFRTNPDVKILIAGLKCGGQGLNFPCANRCISLDLWWNHAVEQQAFGRIFRIGQNKETYMTRIVVRNSVDMRLLNMQMRKLQTCERAMRDREEKDNPALGLADLASLFGFLRTDADGQILGIEPDYDDGNEVGREAEGDEHGVSGSGSGSGY